LSAIGSYPTGNYMLNLAWNPIKFSQ